MSKIINHDIRSVDGKYIQMPKYKGGQSGWGNLAIPNPQEEEASGVTNYPIGTRFVEGERIWKYCYAGAGITRGRGGTSYNRFSNGTNVESATIAAAAADAATSITITAVGTITANMFAGGYAMITGTSKTLLYVESHPAAAAAATCVLTLDQPLRNLIDDDDVVTVFRDQYSDVRYLSSGDYTGFGAIVCVPYWTITSGRNFWGQTWGPCCLAGSDNIGETKCERGLYAMTDGSVHITTANHASENQPAYQYLGTVLGYTGDGDGTGTDMPGAWIYMNLQLSP